MDISARRPTGSGHRATDLLVRRKRSLPVIAAIEAGGPDAAELTRCYDSDEPLNSVAVARLTTMLDDESGHNAAMEQAERYLSQAIDAVPAEQISEDLLAPAHAATHREL